MAEATFSLSECDGLAVSTRFEVPSGVLALKEKPQESVYVCSQGGL